ncbi:MAG: PAS domain S-box protein [Desulforhopalus sp.]
MSFRIKLGVILSSIILVNLALVMTSWRSTDRAIEHHDRMNSVARESNSLFQAINRGEVAIIRSRNFDSVHRLTKAATDLQHFTARIESTLPETIQSQMQQFQNNLTSYRSRLDQLTQITEKWIVDSPKIAEGPDSVLEDFLQEIIGLRQGLEKELRVILDQQHAQPTEKLDEMRLWVIIVSLLGVIISLVIAFLFSARYTALMTQVKKSAEAVTEGSLMTALETDRGDDISQLADIFYQMSEKLRRNFNEIVEYRDNLEELVSARTNRLEKEITERLSTEKALRASEEYLRTIIDQSPMGIIVWDTNFQISQWNKRSEEIFGYSTEEAAGMPANELLPETMHPHIDKIWQKLITTESGVRSRNENIAKDGRVILCDWFNSPISDAHGHILGALSLIENVTERLQEEKELIKIEKLESTGILAGGIAHDFNNILTAILGNINIALRDNDLSDNTRELLVSAEQASIRARVVTRQLLTFAKGGEPVKEPTALGDIIRESTDFVLNTSNVAVDYTLPDDLWRVTVDRGQISQVIENIVLNSRQAMVDDGELIIICENVSPGDSSCTFLDESTLFIRVIIRDSGPGIDQKILDRIFDPYFSTKQEGSGLGLAVSLSIVNKHNGRILVNSEPGKGTEFIIYLPAVAPEATKNENEKNVPPPESIHVLVMDDDESVRRVLQVMLELLGHTVSLVNDGEEALALYRDFLHSDEPIDLVIADLTIPGGMGGKEAIREILKIDPQAKAIVSSGYSSDPVMASCREYGFQVAVNKPYVLEKLEAAINTALANENDAV